MMYDWLEDHLELLFGEATPAQARVYARVPRSGLPEGTTLAGTIAGPHCEYAQTLPARFRFVDRGPGETVLAEAIVPDPCFWTCELPYLYDVSVELRRGAEVLAGVRRSFGIRPLTARGRSLYFAGRRWVLRSGYDRHIAAADIPAWREHHAVLYTPEYNAAVFDAASRHGVLVVTNSREDAQGGLPPDLLLARHAAVGIVLHWHPANPSQPPLRAGNLLYAQYIPPGKAAEVAEWADVVIGDAQHAASFAEQLAACPVPVLAMGLSDRHHKTLVASVRNRCDHLQRRLAPYGDYAGYMM